MVDKDKRHGHRCSCCQPPADADRDAIRRRARKVFGPEELPDRRQFLAALGGLAAAGGFAGCFGNDENGSDNESDPNETTGNESNGNASTGNASTDTTEGSVETLSGTLVTGEQMEVIEGTVTIEDGEIASITEEGVESDDIIIPAFVNPHTHITDSTTKDGERARNFSWSELFIDPGLKGQINDNHTREEKRAAMTRTLDFMSASGTGTFVDFKEEGVTGIEDLNTVDEDHSVDAVGLLTGPIGEEMDLRAELEQADGYNAYYPYSEQTERARELCTELDKVFALHSGEPSTDDIDASLALNPDYTSHMVQAREQDYATLSNNDIGVAALPRSNLVILNELPPLERLHEATTVALGTDNVMLNAASMLREMEFTSKLFDFTPTEVLQMATINGARLSRRGDEIGSIEEGKRARLTVVGTNGELREVVDPIAGIVRRATARDVKRTVLA
jgi:cytosine/adenosine deaminase-related metal-dependent hydrolase